MLASVPLPHRGSTGPTAARWPGCQHRSKVIHGLTVELRFLERMSSLWPSFVSYPRSSVSELTTRLRTKNMISEPTPDTRRMPSCFTVEMPLHSSASTWFTKAGNNAAPRNPIATRRNAPRSRAPRTGEPGRSLISTIDATPMANRYLPSNRSTPGKDTIPEIIVICIKYFR